MFYSFENVERHFFRLQHHGVVEIAVKQGCVHKSWAYISKPNLQSTLTSLLLQRL